MQFFDIPSESAMLKLGNLWANHLTHGSVMFLRGDLGAGKTTLVRGILNGMGHDSVVTSPTYTLIEHYTMAHGEVYHLDLYRLQDAKELEMIGLRDVLDSASTILVEWPERGEKRIPSPHFEVSICYPDPQSNTASEQAKIRRVQVRSAAGVALLPTPTFPI